MLTSMSRIPLQTLPTFRAVATLSNLRAAGEQLHLTHSAVSQQIRLLEEQLGFLVFDRKGRRVVLNAAGAALLQAVEPALAQIDEGMRAAAVASTGSSQRLRITVSPSFAQHWLMPRMAHWRALHPGIAVELHTSQQAMDLPREGFHAAVRQGKGPWRGLEGSRLIDSQQVVVASPAMAARLAGSDPSAWVHEPLLGTVECWEAWFALAGHPCRIQPVAVFNDMGLMLQAAEQGLGIALGRELVAADALRAGRLVQLSPLALATEAYDAYWLVHPPEHRDWPPLRAFREWLESELQIAATLLRQAREAAG
nr:LysR substrate-binding domain-containing protein [uncultured Albidiferax sp.]